MLSDKLLYVIKSFKKEDVKLFEKFLDSPMLNSNKNLIRLYGFIKQQHPEYAPQKLTLELLHKKSFPNKNFNEKMIRNLVYELISCIQRYFAFINYTNDPFSRTKHLVSELNIRKIDKLITDSLKKADEILAGENIRNESFYSNKAFVEQVRYLQEQKNIPVGKSLVLSNIKKEYIRNVSSNFILVMLREYFENRNRDEHIKSHIELRLAENILNFLNNEIEHYRDETSIYLLYSFSKLNDNLNEKGYYDLKELTLSAKGKIADAYLKDLVLELYNYCIIQERNGKTAFRLEAISLIKYLAENNLLLENDGTLHEHNYININAAMLRQNELQWAKDFTISYKDNLPGKIKDNAFYYNMAAIHFVEASKKKGAESISYLDLALENLCKVKTEDFYYTTRINNLQMMIYFEKNDPEPLFNLIDTYKHFLKHNHLIPDDMKERYYNFTKFMSTLIQIKSGSKLFTAKALKKNITESRTEYKKWLLSKIAELDGE